MKKSLLRTTTLLFLLFITACSSPLSSVLQKTNETGFTPKASLPISSPTSSLTPAVTPSPTPDLSRDISDLLDETLEYKGYKFNLILAANNSDPITQEIIQKWGIDRIEINSGKNNVKEGLAAAILQAFLETYTFQSGKPISLQELLQNPEKYPISIMVRNDEGLLVKEIIYLTEIKTFKFVFSSQAANNDEIYMSLRFGDPSNCGFKYSDGVLTLFSTQPIVEQHRVDLLTSGLDINTQLPALIGYEIIDQYFLLPLLKLPFTVKRLESAHGMDNVKVDDIFSRIKNAGNSNLPRGLSADEYLKWTSTHAFFLTRINPQVILPEHTPLLEDVIEYKGYQYPFRITYRTTDLNMKKNLNELGIYAFYINPLNTQAKESLAKAFVNAFHETYVYQTKRNIDLEKYLEKAGEYQINVILVDKNGKIQWSWINLEQIKSIELRFSNQKENLYISLAEVSPMMAGYAFEDGNFVIYTPLDPFERGIRDSLRTDYDHNTELPFHLGFIIGHLRVRNSLSLLPYNAAIYSNYGSLPGFDLSTFGSGFDEAVIGGGMPQKLNLTEYINWLLENCLFMAET